MVATRKETPKVPVFPGRGTMLSLHLLHSQSYGSQKVSYKPSHLGFKEAQNNHFQEYFGFYTDT